MIDMTPREQDAVIAEWMGWSRIYQKDSGAGWYGVPSMAECDKEHYIRYKKVRHYSADLNAMAEAEKVVVERGEKFISEYIKELIVVMDSELDELVDGSGGYFGDTIFVLATATAPQRAEALCRVIEATT